MRPHIRRKYRIVRFDCTIRVKIAVLAQILCIENGCCVPGRVLRDGHRIRKPEIVVSVHIQRHHPPILAIRPVCVSECRVRNPIFVGILIVLGTTIAGIVGIGP